MPCLTVRHRRNTIVEENTLCILYRKQHRESPNLSDAVFLYSAYSVYWILGGCVKLKGEKVRLTKLKQLRDTMQENQIAVFSYRYRYNGVNCFIAVCLLVSEDRKLKKSEYALARLRFMKANNLEEFIDCYANSQGLLTGIGEIRRFFNIPYDENGYTEWLERFYSDFDTHFPSNLEKTDDELNKVNIVTVCAHEGRNPNRTYRHHLLRHQQDENNNGRHRTEYNSQLAQNRFPNLWEVYKSDTTVSFAFTDNPDEELSEEEIYNNFIRIENSRRHI